MGGPEAGRPGGREAGRLVGWEAGGLGGWEAREAGRLREYRDAGRRDVGCREAGMQ